MARYSKTRKEIVVSYSDFHSYSQLWMYPYGAFCDRLAPDHDKMDKAAVKAAVKALKSVHGTSFAAGPIYDLIYQASWSSCEILYYQSF